MARGTVMEQRLARLQQLLRESRAELAHAGTPRGFLLLVDKLAQEYPLRWEAAALVVLVSFSSYAGAPRIRQPEEQPSTAGGETSNGVAVVWALVLQPSGNDRSAISDLVHLVQEAVDKELDLTPMTATRDRDFEGLLRSLTERNARLCITLDWLVASGPRYKKLTGGHCSLLLQCAFDNSPFTRALKKGPQTCQPAGCTVLAGMQLAHGLDFLGRHGRGGRTFSHRLLTCLDKQVWQPLPSEQARAPAATIAREELAAAFPGAELRASLPAEALPALTRAAAACARAAQRGELRVQLSASGAAALHRCAKVAQDAADREFTATSNAALAGVSGIAASHAARIASLMAVADECLHSAVSAAAEPLGTVTVDASHVNAASQLVESLQLGNRAALESKAALAAALSPRPASAQASSGGSSGFKRKAAGEPELPG